MTTDAAPPLRVRGLVKRYGNRAVLDGIDLAVAAGECFGLVGLNGAGKTSLIRAVLDLATIDGGAIELGGQDHRWPGARSVVAYLPERHQPPWFMRGTDYLHAMARLYGSRDATAARARWLEGFGLEAAALRLPVGRLSKGMAQQLGLAAVLGSGRRLLLLDEPMSGLDPLARGAFKAALRARRSTGDSTLFSTHLLDDVAATCDRVGILHGGRLVFVGTPAECMARGGDDDFESACLRLLGAAQVRPSRADTSPGSAVD